MTSTILITVLSLSILLIVLAVTIFARRLPRLCTRGEHYFNDAGYDSGCPKCVQTYREFCNELEAYKATMRGSGN